MQHQSTVRQSSGTKAIAIDTRLMMMKYRLLQLAALLVGLGSAIGLHFIFGR